MAVLNAACRATSTYHVRFANGLENDGGCAGDGGGLGGSGGSGGACGAGVSGGDGGSDGAHMGQATHFQFVVHSPTWHQPAHIARATGVTATSSNMRIEPDGRFHSIIGGIEPDGRLRFHSIGIRPHRLPADQMELVHQISDHDDSNSETNAFVCFRMT